MAIKSIRLARENRTLLEAPVGKSYAITSIIVCNNSNTGNCVFDMHLVATGDPISNGTANELTGSRVINNLALEPEESFTFDTEKIILGPGDKVVLFADGDNIQEYSYTDPDTLSLVTVEVTDLTAFVSYLEI